ncbi:MAG TPA: rod shape-determining protein MreC [Candidatus Omnitrophota bacterium]|nr:rod shape-determining protein MreC [Candidatus Omnitrophota bacterium]
MRRWRSYYFLAVPVLALVLFFQYPRFNEAIHAFFYTLARPAFVIASGLRQGFYALRYESAGFFNAVSKQKEYRARIQELETQLIHYDDMERENARLKRLLNFSKPLGARTVGARVIGEDLTPWKKVVVLDKGSRHNLKKDMVVVVPEGLVGRILEVEPYTSRAILLPDPDCRVSALTSASRAQGIIAGIGTEKLQMRYLSLDAEIALGEDVITSGIGSVFPKGLQIGKIESIERDGDGLHLLALVKPSVPFSKIEEVLCLDFSQQK